MVAPEYRYPNDDAVPEYLRNKTASEAAQMFKAVMDGIGRGGPVPEQQPPQQTLSGTDPVTYADLQAAQRSAVEQISPWLAQVADQQAVVSYNIAKREHSDIFKKWEPEIVATLGKVPRANWTLDVIENAIKFVKGNHVDEIAAEKVRAFESIVESTMRSTGRAGSIPVSPRQDTAETTLEKLPEQWRSHAKAVGIGARELQEFCWANDITMDEFFNQFKDGLVTDAIEDVRIGRSST